MSQAAHCTAGGYAEKIFYRQVENLLSDLQQHLQQ